MLTFTALPSANSGGGRDEAEMRQMHQLHTIIGCGNETAIWFVVVLGFFSFFFY